MGNLTSTVGSMIIVIVLKLVQLTSTPTPTLMMGNPSSRENSFKKPMELMVTTHKLSKLLLEMLPLKFGHSQIPNNLLG